MKQPTKTPRIILTKEVSIVLIIFELSPYRSSLRYPNFQGEPLEQVKTATLSFNSYDPQGKRKNTLEHNKAKAAIC